ncbi:MAG: gas vesicle protein GvpG [Nocardioidaceae bacterium]
MGLIKGVLSLPLGRVRGVTWLAEQIRNQAENEYYDPAVIRAALDEVEMQRELGTIDEEEAERMEETLLARVLASRERFGGSPKTQEEWHG